MATTHKPFRELIPAESNFEFVGNTKKWVLLSTLLILGSIAMLFINKEMRGDYLNWTIDFKGGTEVIVGFEKDGKTTSVGAADVRKALADKGYSGFSVAGFTWDKEESGQTITVSGMKIATTEFGAVPKDKQAKIDASIRETFAANKVGKATWSGDRLFVRSESPIDFAAMKALLASHDLQAKAWDEDEQVRFTSAQAGTSEFNAQFAIRGIDANLEKAIESALDGVDVVVVQTYAVGAKAGAKLRNDGVKSLFFALLVIMLYLVFRFDVRYAPGATIALLHDAFLVIGVFAVTWQEVSLTTVAALLTVIGYSVNDSVVIFDRIRENVVRLKDKRFDRVINVSLNETLSRTLLTSITLFVVTLMMNILGTGLVRNFAFAMNIGVVVGVYSSIFIASPVALAIHRKFYN